MGWSFRKSKKILPGVRASVSHRGFGFRLGGRHAGVSVTPTGARVSGSIPGTGISARKELTSSKSKSRDWNYDAETQHIVSQDTLRGFWLDTEIKLGSKFKTPGGSQVTVLRVCVDIDYRREGFAIQILNVRMANEEINASSEVTGEAFRIAKLDSQLALVEAANTDLHDEESNLRRCILGHSYRQPSTQLSKIMSAILLPIYLVGFLMFAGLGLALVLQPDTPFKILGGVFWLIALVCGLKTRSRLKAFR